jgi:hypothetical protein
MRPGRIERFGGFPGRLLAIDSLRERYFISKFSHPGNSPILEKRSAFSVEVFSWRRYEN